MNFLTTDPFPFYLFSQNFFEKIVYTRLINYLNKADVLTPSQYGFRKKEFNIYDLDIS